jgi:Fic family protein
VADWDADSEQLQANLVDALISARDAATRKATPNRELARGWHRVMMRGLAVPNPSWVAAFRGEPGVERVEVRVGPHPGVPARDVSDALAVWESSMQEACDLIEGMDGDRTELTLDLCGFAHAEWVRVHPFANGNGRIARLWANHLAMRFGLPPFVRLRPRPDGVAYARAGMVAMTGNWRPTRLLFASLLDRFLSAAEE